MAEYFLFMFFITGKLLRLFTITKINYNLNIYVIKTKYNASNVN